MGCLQSKSLEKNSLNPCLDSDNRASLTPGHESSRVPARTTWISQISSISESMHLGRSCPLNSGLYSGLKSKTNHTQATSWATNLQVDRGPGSVTSPGLRAASPAAGPIPPARPGAALLRARPRPPGCKCQGSGPHTLLTLRHVTVAAGPGPGRAGCL